MITFYIAYVARVNNGTVHGIWKVRANRRPGWSEAARAIPGFVTGRALLWVE